MHSVGGEGSDCYSSPTSKWMKKRRGKHRERFKYVPNSVELDVNIFSPDYQHKNKTTKNKGGSPTLPGFLRVMENLESHGISILHFPGLESHGKWSNHK